MCHRNKIYGTGNYVFLLFFTLFFNANLICSGMENQNNGEIAPYNSLQSKSSNLLENILGNQNFIFYKIFPLLDIAELEVKVCYFLLLFSFILFFNANSIRSMKNPDKVEIVPNLYKFTPQSLLANIVAKEKSIFYKIFPFLDFLELDIKVKFLSKEIYALYTNYMNEKYIFYTEIFPFLDFLELDIKVKFLSKEIHAVYTNYMNIQEEENKIMKTNCLTNEKLFLKYLKLPLYGFFQKRSDYLGNITVYEQIIDFSSVRDITTELVIFPKIIKTMILCTIKANEYKICLLTNGHISILKKTFGSGEKFFWTNLETKKIVNFFSSSEKYDIHFKDQNIVNLSLLAIFEDWDCIEFVVRYSPENDKKDQTEYTLVDGNHKFVFRVIPIGEAIELN